jgi:DNA-directed RNA polymerase specialized sigma24 family protein
MPELNPITTPPNRNALMVYLSTLPQLENDVLMAIYFNRRSHQQVADHLEVSVATVGAAAMRALQAVAIFLDGEATVT